MSTTCTLEEFPYYFKFWCRCRGHDVTFTENPCYVKIQCKIKNYFPITLLSNTCLDFPLLPEIICKGSPAAKKPLHHAPLLEPSVNKESTFEMKALLVSRGRSSLLQYSINTVCGSEHAEDQYPTSLTCWILAAGEDVWRVFEIQ